MHTPSHHHRLLIASLFATALVFLAISLSHSTYSLRGDITEEEEETDVQTSIDTDHDGVLSVREMRRGIGATMSGIARQDHAFDFKRSGTVDRDDLRRLIQILRSFLAARCGNRVREAGEKCDDGNTNSGDGCSATCSLELRVQSSGTFAPYSTYATRTNPWSIAIGDLNGDGKADVVSNGTVDSNDGNTVSVLLNNGDGTFAPEVTYAMSTSGLSVAIGDLNGDRKPDLAVTYGSGIAVFLNIGNGTFAPGVEYDMASGPRSVAIGDLNDDGMPDLAVVGVANDSSDVVSIVFNHGDGTFGSKVEFPTGSRPFSVAIGDLNGDGKADVVVANTEKFASGASVSVLLSKGNGTFAPKMDYRTGIGPFSVAIGDLNGDGKADLALANEASSTVSVLLNTGDGTFAATVDYATGLNPFSVAIGDLNGDGKLDLAVANYVYSTASVFLNTGNGTFADKVDYPSRLGSKGISIGDLNGDGKADLAVTGYESKTVSILLNQ